jgi:signal transduction histidine kinase
MQEKLQFKISSALKDIIGRDLITDDFIAVFELVKNSYDAHATDVEISFENLYSLSKNSKITIKDNGKGMNFNDLKNKWLFVGYSAKREGIEDEDLDYRDSIYVKRPFAGAKGIGRFSCDRLGRHLLLETKKKEANAKTEVLITDWEKFETDPKAEFINVSVLHETRQQSYYGLEHGTVLEITDLRSEWDRVKLLKLKDSLAKLINPNIRHENQKFRITIKADEELDIDKESTDERNIVNGEVSNFIFEALGLKTTKITSTISPDGKKITTELLDGGTLIYRIHEANKFELLRDIKVTLFFLNMAAKLTFARRMGLSSRAYGHVFLYKNGFRIYPFGEPFEDPLKIDVRKSRKRYSYLGTGELMGQIEIEGTNDELKETSSRGDGLIKNSSYEQLGKYFLFTLERLEKYVVDVQQWGLSIEDTANTENQNEELNSRISNLIAHLTNSDSGVLEFEYGDNFLDILKNAQENSATTVLQNFKRIAQSSNNPELINQAQRIEKRFIELKAAKDDAENEIKAVKRDIQEVESQNLFLKSVKSQDFDEVISFLHHIGISAKNIDNNLKLLVKKIRKGKVLSNDEIVDTIKKVIFENRKILSISKFASKANFKLYTSTIEIDVINYICEYVTNVLALAKSQKPIVHLDRPTNEKFVKLIKPIELNIIIDNLISNSKRAKADNIYISFINAKDDLEITFSDDGKGIDLEVADKIFDFGFTTTSGSGIGLFHIKKLLTEQGGDIIYNIKNRQLTEFVIKLKK